MVTPIVLLQSGGLTAAQRSVREQFSRGGSSLDVLWVLLVLAGAVFLTYYLTVRLQTAEDSRPNADPAKLFKNLLDRLDLTSDQRQLLMHVSRHAKLEHPASILLSVTLYDRYVGEWLSSGNQVKADPAGRSARDRAAALRRALFPSGKSRSTAQSTAR